MARSWKAKASGETVARTWSPDLLANDAIQSASATATGVTVDLAEYDSGTATITLSGGTNGTNATVAVTVTTRGGLTLTEDFILPVQAEAQAFSYTARDVVDFALRKVVGLGKTARASEADDALERLNDMLAMWRLDGLDLGLPKLDFGDILKVPDEFVSAIKFNLRISCHDHYDLPISQFDAMSADAGKVLVRNALFDPQDLQFSTTLVRRVNDVSELF